MQVVSGGSLSGMGGLYVGYGATDNATLAISGGGTVNTGAIGVVGSSSGSVGTVTVSGTGSTFTTTSTTLDIGSSGTGTLSITSGATVNSSGVELGAGASGHGTVTVDGIGSTWNLSNYLYLGSFGTGSVTLSNGGTLTSSASIFIGDIGGSSGTLNIGAPSGSGAQPGGILNAAGVTGESGSATVQFNTSGSPYYFTTNGTSGGTADTINGSAQVINTAGNNILSGSNNYSGATIVNGGTLAAGSTNAFSGFSAVTVNSGGTLALGGYNNSVGSIASASTGSTISLGSGTLTTGNIYPTTFAGVISGTGGLTEAGTGTLTLTNTETYTGATTINTGARLQLGNGASNGSIASSTGPINDNGTLIVSGSTGGTVSQVIMGTGGVTESGPSVNILSGSNTYSGPTTVNGGTLTAGNANAFGNMSAVTFGGPGTLSLGTFSVTVGSISSAIAGGMINLGANTLTTGGTGNSTTYAGMISGVGGSLFETGDGTLTLTGSNFTYSGLTTIDAGANLRLGNGTTNGTLTGTSGITDNGTLIVDEATVATIGQVITGSGNLVNEGLGTLTLSGSNNYQGNTTVDFGTILVPSETSICSPNGILVVGNVCGDNGALSITSGGSVTMGYGTVGQSSGSTGAVTVDGTGSTWTNTNSDHSLIVGDSGTGTLTISNGGTVNINDGGGTLTLGNASSGTGTLNIGAPACSEAASPGFLSANEIASGCGTGIVQFKTTAPSCTPYYFTADGTCGGQAINIEGPTQVVISDGAVVLNGENSYSGGTLMTGGELFVTSCVSLGGTACNTLTADSSGCTPVLATSGGCVTLPNNIEVNSTGLVLNYSDSSKLTLTGIISDYSCNGTLTINGSVDLEGCNTYSGGTTINCANVTIGTNTGLGTGSVTASDSTLCFTSCSPTLCSPTFNDGTTANFSGNPILNALTLCGSSINFYGSCATLNDMVSDGSESGNEIHLGSDTDLTIHVSCGDETDYHGTITDCGGSGSLTVTGSGLLDLKSDNTYGGGTTINGGLVVASSDGALGCGMVTINGCNAVLGVDSGVTLTNPICLEYGAIGGYGTFASNSTFNIQNGSIIAAGRGVFVAATGDGGLPVQGLLTFSSCASLTFGGGGIYQFAVQNAGGTTPGTDYSSINVEGSFCITASSESPFTIDVLSVNPSGLLGNTAFNTSQSYSWTLLTTPSCISCFSPCDFTIDTSNFNSGSVSASQFSVVGVGDNLVLNFTPVPEPSTWALMAGGLCAVGVVAVRRRRRA